MLTSPHQFRFFSKSTLPLTTFTKPHITQAKITGANKASPDETSSVGKAALVENT